MAKSPETPEGPENMEDKFAGLSDQERLLLSNMRRSLDAQKPPSDMQIFATAQDFIEDALERQRLIFLMTHELDRIAGSDPRLYTEITFVISEKALSALQGATDFARTVARRNNTELRAKLIEQFKDRPDAQKLLGFFQELENLGHK